MGNNAIKLAQVDQKKAKLRDMKNVIIEIRNSNTRLYSTERIGKLEGFPLWNFLEAYAGMVLLQEDFRLLLINT